MDENNVHTSVVIELGKQEEPENQKAYRIDIEDADSPKDYIVDQIFCSDNVTVYALFEVPEGSNVTDKNLIDVPNPNFQDNYKFFHRSSYKEVVSEKKMNRFKQNSSVIRSDEDLKFLSDKDRGNGSLYCLKHLGGDYEMLTPEKKNSELRLLYSKETISKSTKVKTPKDLKLKSKGVNTDIVQSPKIIEEVQRTVGFNIPLAKSQEKNVEDSSSSFCKSSYEIIDMEKRPSYSSVNSDLEKKLVPNFFIVPLLMMDDGTLSHYEKTDKIQKLEEEKLLLLKRIIPPKVSCGTNTDICFDSYTKTDQDSKLVSQSKSYKADSEDYQNLDQDLDLSGSHLYENKENSNEKLKIISKESIIKEIKIMQKKLSILIKSIEFNDFVCSAVGDKSFSKTAIDRKGCLQKMSEPLLNETSHKKYQKLVERPIFLSFRYPSYSNKVKAKMKKRIQNFKDSKKNGASTASKKSVSKDLIFKKASCESIVVSNDQTPTDVAKKLNSNFQVNCLDLENRKTFMLSKSESCVRVITPSLKHNLNNALKKSQSFDLKCDKIEALKKTKNFSYKAECSIKTKTNIRIHQNKEGSARDNLSWMKCEMGDDVNKKSVNTNNESLNVIQVTEKTEKSENSGLKDIVADLKKTFYEVEDAKLDYPKETSITANAEKVQIHYHYANITPSESIMKSKKNTSPRVIIPKTPDKNAEVGTKFNGDVEKPTTPNKIIKKINTIDSNSKKDIKFNKKIISKVKTVEKVNKIEVKDTMQTEAEKKKALTGSRKSARNNGESKLHIDKLIKFENLENNIRTSYLTKNNHDEKTGVRNERFPRPVSQKQERLEHPIDMLLEENIKENNEIPKKKSVALVQVESFCKKNVKEQTEPVCPEDKEKTPEEANLNLTSKNTDPLSSNLSSVVVELFSEKPKPPDEIYCDMDQENAEKPIKHEKTILEIDDAQKDTNKNSEISKKLVVKSVWALTKVLLYEDGTNKLEVLEASLTPPEYSLK